MVSIGSNITISERELNNFGLSLEKIKEDMTLPNPEYAKMVRFGRGFYRKVDKCICYLRKEGDKYILPRYYFNPKDFNDLRVKGRGSKWTFKFKLRDYQQEFVNNNAEDLNKEGVLMEAPCGHGKTILGIWLAHKRAVQTLVLVPTYYLASQWKQRIQESTDATVGILKSSDSEIPIDWDFTIVVMDLFSCRTLPKELVSNIGHVILDEAHRVGAETYMPILDEIPAFYRTALTATFRRTDGVHRILKYHFGVLVKMGNRFPRPLVYAVNTGVHLNAVLSKNRPHQKLVEFLDAEGVPYHETPCAINFPTKGLNVAKAPKGAQKEISLAIKKAEELSYPVVESYLDSHSGRRKMTISLIQKCLDAGRTILFLSKRKATLKALHKYFAKYKPMLIISETNERSAEDEEYLQNRCRLIFGVNQLAKEGLDIDRLDTLIIHLPMKDTEQAVGRVSRLREGKKQPVCFYLLDDSPITFATFMKAKAFFNINAEYKGERNLTTIGTIL